MKILWQSDLISISAAVPTDAFSTLPNSLMTLIWNCLEPPGGVLPTTHLSTTLTSWMVGIRKGTVQEILTILNVLKILDLLVYPRIRHFVLISENNKKIYDISQELSFSPQKSRMHIFLFLSITSFCGHFKYIYIFYIL